jgi:type IV secretion system protein VirB10
VAGAEVEAAGAPFSRNLLPAPSAASPSAATLQAPAGAYLLRAGTFIPATVSHRVVSDQPGLVRAVVSRDVLDSLTAAHVLIPRGTVLLGRQGSLPSLGQDRLAVVWDRLQLPDGRTLRLEVDEALPSAALDGSAGLTGRTRQHWGRRYGAAILLSLVGAGIQLAQPERRGGNRDASPGEVAAGALGLELGRLSQQILRQYADLPPTVELAPGARVHAVLTRDLSFPPSRTLRAR